MLNFDASKSLSQLENRGWNGLKPTEEDSFVIRRSYELLYLPLEDFSVEDVRFYIGQKEGLNYLIPLAIRYLKEDLFVEGDYFEGDLLKNVLQVPISYWRDNVEQKKEVEHLFISNQQAFEELDTTEEIREEIREAFEEFLLEK